MKKTIIILIVLVLIVGAGYLSDLVFGQPITPSGTLYFIMLHDTPTTFTSQAGKYLKVNSAEDALEFTTASGGSTTFLGLTDSPSSFSGQGTKYVRVNSGATALEFVTLSGGGDLLADGSVPMTANWDIGNYDLTLKSLTGDGTIEGATITEGGIAVYNDDEMDAFSELNTIVTDKTLVNEEDAVTWDALGTFGLGLTITTGDPFTLGTNRIDNGSDLLDGEMIAPDTIDDDSIDFGDVTGADLTLTDAGAITASGLITGNAGVSFKNGATAAGFINIYEDSDDGGNYTKIQVVAQGGDITLSLPPDDGDAGEQLQTNGNGVLTWEAAGGAGATAWDDIGDPDAAATVDFTTYTQTIDIGKSDSGGGSGLILDVTGLGAGTDDVIALKITTATDDDTDYIPIEVRDDSGGNNDLLFKVDSAGRIYPNSIYLLYSAFIGQSSGDNYINLVENNDSIIMYFGGTDLDFTWSDGALNLRNNEDGVDAIVEIEGKDAGEKGILRVLSDGDDKYIELYHNDTDAIIHSSSGSINLSSETLIMPKRSSNDENFYNFTIWNPSSIQSDDTQLCIDPNLPAAITITEVTVTCDADPTTELDWNLKWADAFIGLANAALIVAIDTVAGVADVDSGFNDATVALGKCIYIEFDAAPDSATTQVNVKIRWDYD